MMAPRPARASLRPCSPPERPLLNSSPHTLYPPPGEQLRPPIGRKTPHRAPAAQDSGMNYMPVPGFAKKPFPNDVSLSALTEDASIVFVPTKNGTALHRADAANARPSITHCFMIPQMLHTGLPNQSQMKRRSCWALATKRPRLCSLPCNYE